MGWPGNLDLANATGTLPVANGGTGVTASTGTVAVVLSTSPTLVTPTLGVASATSINKVALTAPATAATLTLANNSTLATVGAFTTTLTATAGTALTLPTTGTLATTAYADALVVGLLDDRGNYDASVNTFPAAGGSGTAGAILKGDVWYISVAGTLGGVAVVIGDLVRALADTPGQTAGNWSVLEHNLGYTPENTANKDATGGYVGMTLYKHNFKNAANTFTSFFTNSNTAARTYTFADADGTMATLAGSEAFTNKTYNGNTWTAGTGTFTQAASSSLITVGAFAVTVTASATTNATLPAGTNNLGYLEVPQQSKSANYTTVLADSGKSIDHPSTDANARTFTIDSNANVAYPVGTCIGFSNMTANVVSIAITSDTMNLAGTGTTGTRSLAQYGVAVARKVATTVWLISGTGLT